MSLSALPVTVSDLTTLQSGVEFLTNPSEANAEAAAINAPGATETVFTYAAKLIQQNISLSQVAMADFALMTGATDATAHLGAITTQFLPAQVTHAIQFAFDPTVYAAEAYGLALASNSGFNTSFVTPFASNPTGFATAVANVTGVNPTAILQFVNNWIAFYTPNPAAHVGLSVTQAAYGAAFGDAVGVALLNDTSANLKTHVDLNSDIISGVVANALIDNAEGLYQVGVPLGNLLAHNPLQGEADILNLTGAAGIVDMAQEPTTIRIINYQTPATGSVTIINQTNPLTVNLKDNTIGDEATGTQTLTVEGAAGFNDSLVISLGNPSNNERDTIFAITVTGDELFTLRALGADSSNSSFASDNTGLITLTPTLGGNEHVTLSGDTNLGVGAFKTGAIADATGGGLNVDNMTITVVNTGITFFGNDTTPGTLLKFVADAGANGLKAAPSIGYSTNAVTIDASTSGGFFMLAGDANFNPGTSAGDVIIGAANPVGLNLASNFVLPLGNILVGSIGNDTITSKSMILIDTIYTNGGADKITLAAGHTGADHVGFYAADGVGNNFINTLLLTSVTGAVSEALSAGGPATEFVNPGWWGIAAGGSSTPIVGGLFSGVATGTGTSADNSTLTGYVANQDFLDFSGVAWSGLLTADQAGALVSVSAASLTSDAGTAVSAAQVAKGGTISGAGTVDFIVLSQDSFLNAAAVAGALSGGSYTIHHSSLANGADVHFLVAYAGQDGNAHIADLHLSGGAAGSTDTVHDTSVYASDIVTLVGVNLAELDANISHVHLVT